jgi:hypothetical protein
VQHHARLFKFINRHLLICDSGTGSGVVGGGSAIQPFAALALLASISSGVCMVNSLQNCGTC